tara:strand:+ start:3621 stop:4688 length:1068 start_codon:yes stop_codon:yes gene_type:complete
MRIGGSSPYPNFSALQHFPGVELPPDFEPRNVDKRRTARIFKEAIATEPKHGCLAPLGDGKTCGKTAIKSHTVGLSRELAAIADHDNRVCGAKLKMSAMFDVGNGSFEDICVKQASAFPGFCNTHDTEIFRPIDDEPWNGSDQHKFLLAYRALCNELYAKFTNVESVMPASIRNAEAAVRDRLIEWNKGELLGLKESLRDKHSMDARLLAGDFQCDSHVVSHGVNFPLRVAGIFVPEFDYYDQCLYDLSNYSKPVHPVSVCTLTTKDDVLGIYVALDDTLELNKYMKSLRSVTRDDPRAFFAQSCFENFEQVYFSSVWWNSLRERHRIGIEARFESSGPGNRIHGMTLDPMFRFI